jgi:LysM repeat protein
MRRFLFALLAMGIFVVFMEPAGNLLSNLLRLEQPLSHEIKDGDWLSKISQQYYGDPSYWKELALVNRAPSGDRIFPGERVIVPDFDAIQRVRQARRLSDVNEVVNLQEDILAGRVKTHSEPLAQREPEDSPSSSVTSPSASRNVPAEPSEEMSEPLASDEPAMDFESYNGESTNGAEAPWLSTPVVTGVVIVAVILVMGIFMYYRKKKREEVEFYGSTSKSDDDDEKKSPYLFENEDEDRRKGGTKHREKEVSVV